MRYIFLYCLIFIAGSVFSQWKNPETKNVGMNGNHWRVTYSDPIEKIKNVKNDQLKRAVDIDSSSSLISSPEHLEDFSFFGIAAAGYAKVTGPYYEGFNSATNLRLALSWFIDAPWFIEFYYGHSSFAGEQITRLVDYTAMDRTTNDLSFNEYGLGVGRTISLFSGHLRIYALLGLTLVSQTQNFIYSPNQYFPNPFLKSYGEIDKLDLGGYKMEAGFIIPVINKIQTILSFSFQVHEVQKYSSNLIAVYSDGTSSSINDENNGVFNLTIGILYPF